MSLNIDARLGAQKQWNARACGELPGEKQSVAYFDAVAADRYRQQPWMHDYFRFGDFSGKHVLEIGIGQGTDMMEFAKAGAICHGVDITENHLKLTALNATLRGYQVDLHEADATRLPFADNSMDCVYSFGVLHHIPEIDEVMREIHRVLKPGGTVMIALYRKWSAFHIFKILFLKGIMSGWLFRKGYDGLLATIEMGADGLKIKPYVKLYDSASVLQITKIFEKRNISVHQLFLNHFLPTALLRPFFEIEIPLQRLENKLGWYIAFKGQKKSGPGRS